MTPLQEKTVAKQAAVVFVVVLSLLGLLLLDLINQGLVWRFFNSLRSRANSTLPDEKRTVGRSYQTDVTFLS